jgi:hypothetical protein
MKRHGWGWRGGSGLMTDYYYIKPRCRVQGGSPGRDYFVRVEDVMEFARDSYGWREGGSSSIARGELFSRIEDHARHCGEIVPPLLDVEGRETTLGDHTHGPWRAVWETMLRSKWTWRSGTGLMLDYYYIKPGSKVGGGVEGQDYFVKLEDVQKFAARNYGWRGEDGGAEGTAAPVAAAGTIEADSGRCRTSVGANEVRKESDGAHEVRKEKRQKVEKCAKKPARTMDACVEEDTASDEGNRKDSTAHDDTDGESTFSQSGFRTMNLFLDECADENVPPLTCDIDPYETWSYAWEKMRQSGWTWKVGAGLMTDYYYVKPGCKVKGGAKGRDFFVLEEDVRRFATRNYGWRGSGGCIERSSNAAPGGGVDGRKRGNSTSDGIVLENKRQKGEDQQVAATSSNVNSSLRSQPAVDPFEKRAVWQALQREGWKAISAGRYNKLHDWYYVRPGCDPGDGTSKLGVDYFLSEDAAIEFAGRSAVIPSASTQMVDEEQQPKASIQAVTEPCNGTKKSNEKHQVRGRMHEINHLLIVSKTAGSGTPAGPLNTPPDCRTKPQDPAIPLPSSAESCSSTSRHDSYGWSRLWPLLETAGWQIVKAGKYNPLHDWYYVRPGRHPGDEMCKLGADYFTSEKDVIEFVKFHDENESAGELEKKSVMLEAFEEAKFWT